MTNISHSRDMENMHLAPKTEAYLFLLSLQRITAVDT